MEQNMEHDMETTICGIRSGFYGLLVMVDEPRDKEFRVRGLGFR